MSQIPTPNAQQPAENTVKINSDDFHRHEYLQFLKNLPIMAHAIDKDGRLIGVSEPWLAKLGYSRQEVLGRKSTDFLTDESRKFAEESSKPVLFATGSVENIHHRFLKKDRSTFDGLLSAKSFVDENNNFLYSCTTIIDISDQEQARHELLSSNRRYRALFEEAPVPVWEEDFTDVFRYFDVLRDRGVKNFRDYFENNPDEVQNCAKKIRIINVNQAAVKLHGASNKDELLGNLDKIFTRISFAGFKEELTALANGENEIEFEGKVKTLSGDLRYVFIKLFTFTKPSGEVIALVTTIDITKRKHAEMQVKANEEKYRLLIENQSDLIVNLIF